jgi:hypothetical protein
LFWELAEYCWYKGRSDLATPRYTAALTRILRELRFDAGFGWAWAEQEIIMVSEARAYLTAAQRVIGSPGGASARHLAVCDNQPLVFALRKGTSGQPTVNRLLQRLLALQFASNATLDVVWIPTHIMPADRASRRHRRP